MIPLPPAAHIIFKLTSGKNVMKGLAIIVILVVVIVGYKKFRKNRNQAKFDKNETKDVNQIALQYRTASNPSGIEFLIDTDGTDEDAIEKLAFQTKGVLDEVASAYKLKFDETLSDRMSKELDSDELQNWRNIVT